jgi:aldehyde dehydrogenase
MIYALPGAAGAKLAYKAQYNNFIGGKWVAPVKGQYFDVITPITGKAYTQAARSTAEDMELALDAAHAAADAWGKTDAATRSNILLKDCRPHRSQPGTAGLRRNRGQRQGHPRNPERRHPPHH